MVRSKLSILVYAIIGLAIIGVISQLFMNPAALFNRILIMIGISVVILAIFYFLFARKRTSINNDEMKKYKQAVKQSQKKYHHPNMRQTIKTGGNKQSFQLKKKNRRRASHLRVIDGTGGKQNEKNEPHIK